MAARDERGSEMAVTYGRCRDQEQSVMSEPGQLRLAGDLALRHLHQNSNTIARCQSSKAPTSANALAFALVSHDRNCRSQCSVLTAQHH